MKYNIEKIKPISRMLQKSWERASRQKARKF